MGWIHFRAAALPSYACCAQVREANQMVEEMMLLANCTGEWGMLAHDWAAVADQATHPAAQEVGRQREVSTA